jgi:hypothetical protein
VTLSSPLVNGAALDAVSLPAFALDVVLSPKSDVVLFARSLGQMSDDRPVDFYSVGLAWLSSRRTEE